MAIPFPGMGAWKHGRASGHFVTVPVDPIREGPAEVRLEAGGQILAIQARYRARGGKCPRSCATLRSEWMGQAPRQGSVRAERVE